MSKIKVIHLFTMHFPYGYQETFLESELKVFEEFDLKIIIHPLFGHKAKRSVNYEVYPPILNSIKDCLMSVLSATFYQAFFLGLADIKSFAHFFKLIKQCLIVPGVSKRIKKLNNEGLYYFYWGTNSANVIIFETINHIVRFHGYDLYESDVRSDSVQVLRESFLNNLRNASFVTEHGLRYFLDKYKYTHNSFVSRLGVLSYGLTLNSTDNKMRILSCSNLIPIKRVGVILEALRTLTIEIEWTHIGSGKLFDSILAISSNLPSNIKACFLGQLSNDEVKKFYLENKIDLFINVSESEGLPVSIMEACSFGVPVIATNVGGISELVPSDFMMNKNINHFDISKKILWFYERYYACTYTKLLFKRRWEEQVNAQKNFNEFKNILEALMLN